MGCHSTKINVSKKIEVQSLQQRTKHTNLSSLEKFKKQKLPKIREYHNPAWKILFLDQSIMNSSIMSRRKFLSNN